MEEWVRSCCQRARSIKTTPLLNYGINSNVEIDGPHISVSLLIGSIVLQYFVSWRVGREWVDFYNVKLFDLYTCLPTKIYHIFDRKKIGGHNLLHDLVPIGHGSQGIKGNWIWPVFLHWRTLLEKLRCLNSETSFFFFIIGFCWVRLQTWSGFKRPISPESINTEWFWSLAADCYVDWKRASSSFPPIFCSSDHPQWDGESRWWWFLAITVYWFNFDWLYSMWIFFFFFLQTPKATDTDTGLWSVRTSRFSVWMALGHGEKNKAFVSSRGETGKCQREVKKVLCNTVTLYVTKLKSPQTK